MRYVVIYDITDDNLRSRVAETLKNYGLERIQYSAFLGQLPRRKLNSMAVDLRRLLASGCETDNVQFFPLCDACYRGRSTVGSSRFEEEAKRREKGRVAFF